MVEAPDGGYGWVIVAVAYTISMIADGIGYTFGIMVPHIVKLYECSTSAAVLVGSLNLGATSLIGMIVFALTNIISCRSIIVSGGVLTAAALIACVFVPNIMYLTVLYGLVVGVGLGLTYLPAMVSVNLYFDQRRALAQSITTSGSCLGYFIWAPVLNMVIECYQLNGGFVTTSVMSLVCSVLGFLVKPLMPRSQDTVLPLERPDIMYRGSIVSLPEDLEGRLTKAVSDNRRLSFVAVVERDNDGRGFKLFLKKMFDPKVFTNSAFVYYSISRMLKNFALLIPHMYLPSLMLSVGSKITSAHASYAISILGISNLVSRLGSGIMTKFPHHSLKINTICLLLAAVTLAVYPHCIEAYHFYITTAMYGLLIGPLSALTTVNMVQLVGMDLLTTAYGFNESAYGLMVLVGPVVIGFFVDYFGQYKEPLYIAAGFMVMSSLFNQVCEVLNKRSV